MKRDKMEIVALNGELSEYEIKAVSSHSKIVYHYTDGGYDGWGELIGWNEDGSLSVYDLGHCSCFGPTDEGPYETLTVEEYIAKNTGSIVNGKLEIIAYLKANHENEKRYNGNCSIESRHG
jgi:hypothetical protein